MPAKRVETTSPALQAAEARDYAPLITFARS